MIYPLLPPPRDPPLLLEPPPLEKPPLLLEELPPLENPLLLDEEDGLEYDGLDLEVLGLVDGLVAGLPDGLAEPCGRVPLGLAFPLGLVEPPPLE